MKRLVRLFLLIVLRVAVVCAVTLWGTSRIATLGATTMIGFTAYDLMTFREGIAVCQIPGDLVPTSAYWQGEVVSWDSFDWNATRVQHRSLFGYHVWSTGTGYFQIGVTYLTAIVSLLLIYFLVELAGAKRTHGSLRQRLKAALSSSEKK